MSELITVTAQIPSDRVPDYYEMVAELNRPKQSVSDKKLPQSWTKGDKQLAKQVFNSCSPNARKVLKYLADRSDQKVLGAEIATALGMGKGHQAIAGILGPVGIHCKKVNRDRPYTTNYAEGATAAFYIMPKEIADLFVVGANEV